MRVNHVELLVEEPSMEAALRILLPRVLNRLTFHVYPFQCKEDLLSKLSDRLRGYKQWLPPEWRIVVLMDRDDDECEELKQRLEQIAADADLATRSGTGGRYYSIANRLAIEELEAWYFGDWAAVRAAYPRVTANVPNQAPYRNPDAIQGGTWEAFERVLQRFGYFQNGLRKIEVARAVATQMQVARNASKSFQVFRDVLGEMESA